MAHGLPALPYAYDALEPYIDAQTLQIHHGKHHQAYFNNLNAALQDYPDLQSKPIEELLVDLEAVPESIRTAVRNNGGGHANHALYWQCMGIGFVLTGDLAQAINEAFGSFDNFKDMFSKAGMTRFGSGWAWLSVNKEGKLVVTSTPNQDTPLSEGLKPILVMDVWEHAYYLKYQNRRPDYVAAWWSVVNWAQVAKNYAAAK